MPYVSELARRRLPLAWRRCFGILRHFKSRSKANSTGFGIDGDFCYKTMELSADEAWQKARSRLYQELGQQRKVVRRAIGLKDRDWLLLTVKKDEALVRLLSTRHLGVTEQH